MTAIISQSPVLPAIAISQIDLANKPVIFWDTCGLLDILRLPLRGYDYNILSKLVEIKNKIDSNDFISVASEISITEWNDHAENTIKILKTDIKNKSKNYNGILEFINQTGITSPIPLVNLSTFTLEETLKSLALSILNKTIFVSYDSFVNDAMIRVVDKIAPSSINKSESKDCIVWETCLSIRTNMSNKSNNFVFHSSNKKDFFEDGGNLKDQLATESATIQLTASLDLHHLHHKINN